MCVSATTRLPESTPCQTDNSTMTHTFHCLCGNSIECDEELAGQRATCNLCGAAFLIPGPILNPAPISLGSGSSSAESVSDLEWGVPSQKVSTGTDQQTGSRLAQSITIACYGVILFIMIAILFTLFYPAGQNNLHQGLPSDKQPVSNDNEYKLIKSKAPFNVAYIEGDVSAQEATFRQHGGTGFKITSTSDAPITVENVLYNGEFRAKRAKRSAPRPLIEVDDKSGFPVVLKKGESVLVAWLPFTPGASKSAYGFYSDVKVIEIYTNRGIFAVDRVVEVTHE
jgi:hypothetical protein